MKRKRVNWNRLDSVLDESFDMLKRGVAQSNDPFHWPVLGSIGNVGSNQRAVILRQFILPERVLVCYTDARAPKVTEISQDDRVSWLFYHPRRKIQLRIYGRATLHNDDQFADDQWAAAPITSRLNYCATDSPGTVTDKPTTGLPDYLADKIQTLIKSEKGRDDFMVIVSTIDVIDWLRLSVTGNRRARFSWDEEGLHATWLVP